MLYAALKLTHDGTLAVADDDQILFSVELEKIHNNPRHYSFQSLNMIDEILSIFNYSRYDIDYWIVDGWELDPDSEGNKGLNIVKVGEYTIPVNNYSNTLKGLSEETIFEGTCSQLGKYVSFSHVYDHLCSSYCTSNFAKDGKDAYVLMFDGGVKPQLYYFDYANRKFIFLKELMKFGGDIYTRFASETESFSFSKRIRAGKSTFTQKYAGRVMAYVALGNVDSDLLKIYSEEYNLLDDDNNIENEWEQNAIFVENVFQRIAGQYTDEDIICSFHYFLQEMLCNELIGFFSNHSVKCNNLCLCGGNFLNIKWNSAIRNLGIFNEVYAPPFINDSGVAIGALCAFRLWKGYLPYIKFSPYSGPEIGTNFCREGWNKQKCSIKELALFIADTQSPVVLLNGRSELGPRALGNRSIIADARSIEMKDKLNELKCREPYRPIAPICLEDKANQYFIPGGQDKYMLFEHVGTEYGLNAVPAIYHLDKTARLQTVSKDDNKLLYGLLCEYQKITGESVLCNTSANASGKGFFPDIFSAQKWGRIDAIWCEGYLYTQNKDNT